MDVWLSLRDALRGMGVLGIGFSIGIMSKQRGGECCGWWSGWRGGRHERRATTTRAVQVTERESQHKTKPINGTDNNRAESAWRDGASAAVRPGC